jgi:hypothetical protein
VIKSNFNSTGSEESSSHNVNSLLPNLFSSLAFEALLEAHVKVLSEAHVKVLSEAHEKVLS